MELEQQFKFTSEELNKLEAWILDPNRLLSINEFDPGPMRQVAEVMESTMHSLRSPIFRFGNKYANIRSRKE